MMSLPGCVFYLSLLRTCLTADIDAELANDSEGNKTDVLEDKNESSHVAEQISQGSNTGLLMAHAKVVAEPFRCKGICKEEHACNAVLKQIRCDSGLVCCIDPFEEVVIPKKFSGDVTIHNIPRFDSKETQENSNAVNHSFVNNGSEGNASDIASLKVFKLPFDHIASRSLNIIEHCPGICVPHDFSFLCYHTLSLSNVCQAGAICCAPTRIANKYNARNSYQLGTSLSSLVKRSVHYQSETTCPGKCVYLSHALSCDEILPNLSCPLNTKCCIQRSTERAFQTSTPVECTGQCLPLKMRGYCFPPNELVLGLTSCSRGTTCCMRRSQGSHIQTPSVNRMQFPHIPNKVPNSDASQVALGHLAVDEAGKVFKIGTNGQIFPLSTLTQLDHMRTKFTRLTAYPRLDGDIVIFADPNGGLYQQFYPRHSPLAIHGSNSSSKRKPTKEFTKDSDEKVSKDKITASFVELDDSSASPILEASTPTIFEDKTSRPQCPGSCMSYFLRFTCFRGYAIYDGFTCPGKLVCCARLRDIEEHEEHLKSLSPYFSEPSSSRAKTFHRCGIKGRRDAPRIIGGKESLPGEWCWQVAIINVQNQYICGGVLIDNSWVLTAAHCVSEPVKDNQVLFVRAGVTDLKSLEDNEKGQTVRVLSSFIHHNFNNVNLDNNIALLRLQKPLDFNDNVCVICLPTTGQMPQGSKKCTVSGYGFVSKDGDMSLKIREAQVPIIDDTECMNNVTEALTNPFIIPANSFCAGGQGQQDACQGDAGGPLACEIGGYHELVGLVSWGLGCGRTDIPSIYIKVPAFMGWINQIISSSSFLMSLT
ncbi:uncharacterized protein LOC129959498 isoform X1 [Argiope bruennichi]|uniref:uncharacterized protein LOC129959498 isoform X1 n=1 Tax=Argiope bruennichi TaxID=94029 RepID=UPI00249542CE|nr:uncharacterized protein LOC129959498 isoform X1 [Argiope bruennichi]